MEIQLDYTSAASDPVAAFEELPEVIVRLSKLSGTALLSEEVDLGKIRSMEFMELLQERRALYDKQSKVDVSSIGNFDEQVCDTIADPKADRS